MIKELINDLSARVSYRPYVLVAYHTETSRNLNWEKRILSYYLLNEIEGENSWNYIKPYLRPLSSMTEAEKKEWDLIVTKERDGEGNDGKPYYTGNLIVYVDDLEELVDWLNQHHFDYRGLIEKGLALEAPEEMYK